VFVLNSEYEGLSHTLIEVQTLGTAIVCTGVCGNPEVVEHEVNGLLVPPRDDAALREALRRLLDDRDMRQRFVAAGYERAKSFVRETTFAEVEQVLAAAASGQRP
jgi:glycosyltransferase involved in cell wall biosynthesis